MPEPVTRRRFLERGAAVSLIAAIAGCSGGDGADGSDETATPEPTLSVAEFVFCDAQPTGYDQYTAREGATYRVEETIWVYLDVRDIGSEPVGEDEVAIDLDESITVIDPSGEAIIDQVIEFDNQFAADTDLQTFFIVNDLHLPSDASAGDYDLEVALSDGITGDRTEVSGTFTAESSG